MSYTDAATLSKAAAVIPKFKAKDWNKVLFEVLVTCHHAKFTQDPGLRQKLMNTGMHVIGQLQGQSKKTSRLDIGTGEEVSDISKWNDSNLNGKALMWVRYLIKKGVGPWYL